MFPAAGEIILAAQLDREKRDQYALTIRASDPGGLVDFATLHVYVTDVNDNAPVIQQTRYEVSLPIYPDQDLSGTFKPCESTFNRKLISDSDISCAKSFENLKGFRKHWLQLHTREFMIRITIQPKDYGEAAWKSSSTAPVSLPLRVTADDIDLGSNAHVIYRFPGVSQMPNSSFPLPFSIASNTGELLLNRAVTPTETHSGVISFQVEACDQPITGDSLCSEPVEVVVHLAPTDNLPNLTVTCSSNEISESDVILTEAVAGCHVSSPGIQGAWSLEGTRAATKAFRIDQSTGLIYVSNTLDFETRSAYLLIVKYSTSIHHEETEVPVTAVAQLSLQLTDKNDCYPEFSASEYWVSIPEDLSTGSKFFRVTVDDCDSDDRSRLKLSLRHKPPPPVFEFYVTDPDTVDRDLLTFYFVEQPKSSNSAHQGPIYQAYHYFGLSPGGELYLRQPLDCEEQRSHTLHVKASDGLFETERPFVLKVIIEDENDNAPFCVSPRQEIAVSETLPLDTVLPFNITATDADVSEQNSRMNFSLFKGDARLFAVDPSTGEIRLVGPLDYETTRTHHLQVKATDFGGLFCLFSDLRIQVLDENDNEPKFSAVQISPVPEDALLNSLIGKVNAVDADSVQTLDRETQAVHQLTILAIDGAPPDGSTTTASSIRHTATASVSISLLDVNDFPPQFLDPQPLVNVSELTPVGSLLMRFQAFSLDEGENGVIRYRLLESQPEFILNATSGELHLGSPLDYERASGHFLTIEARDGGTPSLSTTTVARINVIDVNDNRPRFIRQQAYPLDDITATATGSGSLVPTGVYVFEIPENTPEGTQFGRVRRNPRWPV
ncbi:unnamed protein product [Dibothriocephalus latus]|uniref:Cadherin domain-containing protein n=1 Tax=Dibothriocephalus latus TaxID=60516 RepID=A0A3P7LFJ8_DIBLA|nr:unnamed protein product [Dibothriocephalus latus]